MTIGGRTKSILLKFQRDIAERRQEKIQSQTDACFPEWIALAIELKNKNKERPTSDWHVNVFSNSGEFIDMVQSTSAICHVAFVASNWHGLPRKRCKETARTRQIKRGPRTKGHTSQKIRVTCASSKTDFVCAQMALSMARIHPEPLKWYCWVTLQGRRIQSGLTIPLSATDCELTAIKSLRLHTFKHDNSRDNNSLFGICNFGCDEAV